MGYTLMLEAPKKLGFNNYEEPRLEKNQVRIQTLYSGISAGTELTAYRGSNPYLHKQWNAEKRLFVEGNISWDFPMEAIAYEEVGKIVELGKDVTGLEIGQVVWGVWGHKSSHIADEDWVKLRILPTDLDPVCGIFSQIGAIALNAILDANIHVGETVAIFGQGVLGLMATQLAKANGAEIIAIDRMDSRLEKATSYGADYVINGTNINVAEKVSELTNGKGADVSIELTGIYAALHDAIRSTAYNSRVVVSGFFQGDGIGLALGEEFHHNRIQLICSQIGGISRDLDHRWDRLRLDQTIMKLMANNTIDFKSLISHTFSAKDAQEAFLLLDKNPADALQVVLKFEA